jgi:hypothetical protein
LSILRNYVWRLERSSLPRNKNITGIGVTTRVAMESADLGIARWDEQRQANAIMFGDNFEFWRMQGEWQSPSIVMYDSDLNVLGVPTKTGIDPNGRRKQLWDYPHNNPDYSTILPCDFIKVGDWWYVAAMVTAGLGNEKRTVFWRSRDLYDWEKTDPYVRLNHKDAHGNEIGHPGDCMLTFDEIDGYVYTFGTNGLKRDRGIWLWRVKVEEFPYGYFEPWGMDNVSWGWGIPNERSPILPGRFGELCFRHIQGNCVLSFFDAGQYRQTALTVVNPTDNWHQANRVDYAHGQQFPQLYGGYFLENARLNEPDGFKFLVSQWNTANNDPYWVVQFNDTLHAMGPLVEPRPKWKPIPKPIPKPPEEIPVPPVEGTETKTPQELYELLLQELSASGSVKITTHDGDLLTLREAIQQIFDKETGLYGLENGRPYHPMIKDDQLGHVLSARAEGLFTQTLVVALAEKAGINCAQLYAQVQDALE